MKRDAKLWAIAIIAIIAAFGILGTQQSILGGDETGYSKVAYQDRQITYSDVTKQYNDGKLRSSNVFVPYGGNINAFLPFYKNTELLSWYLQNALSVNPQDFEILDGDGDSVPFGCHLRPNYCIAKPEGKTGDAGIDSDGCPRWVTYQTTQKSWCFRGERSYSDPCVGAAQCGWVDCSTYSVVNTGYGGAIQAPESDYKPILEQDGWSWNHEKVCWQKGNPSDSKMQEVASKLYCSVSGTFISGESYSFSGRTEWGEKKGFVCNAIPPSESKISDGRVIFTLDRPASTVTIQPISQPVSQPSSGQDTTPAQTTTPSQQPSQTTNPYDGKIVETNEPSSTSRTNEQSGDVLFIVLLIAIGALIIGTIVVAVRVFGRRK